MSVVASAVRPMTRRRRDGYRARRASVSMCCARPRPSRRRLFGNDLVVNNTVNYMSGRSPVLTLLYIRLLGCADGADGAAEIAGTIGAHAHNVRCKPPVPCPFIVIRANRIRPKVTRMAAPQER